MTEEKTAVGRPRSETARQELMEVALRLVRRDGYAHVSISQIARAAGVARQTLYNRWPTKAALILDAFFARAATQVAPPDLSGVTGREQLLCGFLEEIFDHLARDGETLRSLIAAAQADPEFRQLFWDRFVNPRAEIVMELLRDAQARGELSAERDLGLLVTLVHGAFWYRLLNGQPLDRALAAGLAQEVFRR